MLQHRLSLFWRFMHFLGFLNGEWGKWCQSKWMELNSCDREKSLKEWLSASAGVWRMHQCGQIVISVLKKINGSPLLTFLFVLLTKKMSWTNLKGRNQRSLCNECKENDFQARTQDTRSLTFVYWIRKIREEKAQEKMGGLNQKPLPVSSLLLVFGHWNHPRQPETKIPEEIHYCSPLWILGMPDQPRHSFGPINH